MNGLRQLYRDVRSQKLRTFLTVFGIVWGTVAVSLLLAFGRGFHEQAAFADVVRDGLLDVDMLACFARQDGCRRVPVVGGGNNDGIE